MINKTIKEIVAVAGLATLTILTEVVEYNIGKRNGERRRRRRRGRRRRGRIIIRRGR